jgi:hypothetical protein
MPTLTAQESKIVEMFRQLDRPRRRQVLLAMTSAGTGAWRQFQPLGQERLRALAAKEGIDWDHLGEEERQGFIEKALEAEAK